ncbi:hypothetical protein FPK38_14980 [Acinetobacter baumannii]|uniref:Uncharacterized protein n=20 Tax=Acinetobacter baumannii TaxID=470 RepID=A0A0B4B5C5_ACIBA|nr:Hypothetical protein ABK1_3783 [Acinetobacter baumannii 1656-2]AII26482.1 hypothetical protein M3Q_pABCC79 [Acinetobacter baumannii TYTH-1]AKA33573.1 hypothetical protein ABUW_4002 [Acinetobacter baumannii]AYX94922.1 hypothetical protein EGY13_00375 [Acinetobacter sp. FDAARGOS_493]EGT92858.1 hypothetical protein ABNIH3_15631 [Acinetobacter baumannii ABNIH3]EJG16516.1 hypothetical protein ACIN5143_A4320 [Acinetobacter baumannii OIFC143]EJO37587.1 hypothetical protein ACINIS123_A0021 [Acinet
MENLYFFNERNKYLKDIKYLIFLLLQNSIEDASIEHQKLISMSVRILNNGVLYKMDFSSLISFKNELINLNKELNNGNK